MHPTCSHVYPCAGTPCDKLLDEVYDDLKDINLYDILWTCYHGGRPRQEALMQVTASLTHYTSLLLSSCGGNIVVLPLRKFVQLCDAWDKYRADASSAASCVKS